MEPNSAPEIKDFNLFPNKKASNKNIVQKHPVLFPFLIFLLILSCIALLQQVNQTPLIGVVKIDGVVLTSEEIIEKMRKLEHNPAIKGIILRIDSPGGAVSPAQEIFTEVSRLKKNKKVYTSIASVAASGGYYIAAASDKIYGNPGSITGSIGVLMQTFNVENLLNKIGVQSLTIKSGKNKDLGSTFRKMKPDEKALIQKLIDDTQEQFVTAVAESRPLSREKVEKLADGRIFTGRQALKAGLIDGLASFREVVELLKENLQIKEKVELFYPKSKDEVLRDLFDVSALNKLKILLENRLSLFYLYK